MFPAGNGFQRAKGPLDVVKSVMKLQETKGKSKAAINDAARLLDDADWETLY